MITGTLARLRLARRGRLLTEDRRAVGQRGEVNGFAEAAAGGSGACQRRDNAVTWPPGGDRLPTASRPGRARGLAGERFPAGGGAPVSAGSPQDLTPGRLGPIGGRHVVVEAGQADALEPLPEKAFDRRDQRLILGRGKRPGRAGPLAARRAAAAVNVAFGLFRHVDVG